jgi:hypothetical protein
VQGDRWSKAITVPETPLESSPIWDLWPAIIFCPKVPVLSLWGALSNEWLGLSVQVVLFT